MEGQLKQKTMSVERQKQEGDQFKSEVERRALELARSFMQPAQGVIVQSAFNGMCLLNT